jgi:hypothetical protein
VFEKSDLWENQKVRGSSVRGLTVKLTRVGHDLINVFIFLTNYITIVMNFIVYMYN